MQYKINLDNDPMARLLFNNGEALASHKVRTDVKLMLHRVWTFTNYEDMRMFFKQRYFNITVFDVIGLDNLLLVDTESKIPAERGKEFLEIESKMLVESENFLVIPFRCYYLCNSVLIAFGFIPVDEYNKILKQIAEPGFPKQNYVLRNYLVPRY